MQQPTTVSALTELGRVRLSEHFFMREMLYSEVANLHAVPNIPEDPDAAIFAGEQLCRLVLEPLRKAFGHVAVRSAYRSPTVNDFCHQRYKAGDTACFCSDNGYNAARHIWDRRDKRGSMGAMACIVVLEDAPTSGNRISRIDMVVPLDYVPCASACAQNSSARMMSSRAMMPTRREPASRIGRLRSLCSVISCSTRVNFVSGPA